jgi:formate/nitrite transporter FocA (FNT family)
MIKILRYIAYFGGHTIVALGLLIMLIENDTGETPHDLVALTLALVFIIGTTLIVYLVRNRGM